MEKEKKGKPEPEWKRSMLSRIVDAQTGGMLRKRTGPGIPATSSTVATAFHLPQRHHVAGSFSREASLERDIKPKKGPRTGDTFKNMTDSERAEMTHLLMDSVSKCSRQKMRYILMNFRRISGVDSYLHPSDLMRVLQDNGLFIPSTVEGLMLGFCSDNLGVDSEKVWKLLMDVHSESDRDSVRARKGMHLRTPIISVFADYGGDRELLEHLEAQFLAAADTSFDFKTFKTAVLNQDKNRRGYVPNTQLLKVSRDHAFPVTSEVLKSLLIRCDDDNNGKISHREFFVLVDKAYDNALRVNPKLFMKKEEPKPNKKADAGRFLEDGAVVMQTSRVAVSAPLDADGGSPRAYNEGDTIETITEVTEGNVTPRSAMGNNTAIFSVIDQAAGGKPKGKMFGRMKGLLPRKKTASSLNTDGTTITDGMSDTTSLISSTYSAISKVTSTSPLYNNRDQLSSNGILEKPIHPVVRKLGDNKLVLWPPDEYFDSVTPKIREPKLEWVYGYSGFSHRNNVCFLNNAGSVLYFVGQMAIMYSLNTQAQRSYCEHDGPIQCIAATKDGTVACTGQSSYKEDILATIRVWTTDALKTLHVFKTDSGGALTNSVTAVTFTKDDDAVVAIDDGKPRTLSVWSLDTGLMLTSKPCTESPVVCGIFGLRSSVRDNSYVLFGRNLMEVWRIVPTEKRIDFVRQCIFGHIPKPAIITCVMEIATGNGDATTCMVSGDSDGNVILWNDEMRPKTVLQTGNKVPVFTICTLSPSVLLTGSRDGQLSVLTILPDNAVTSTKTKIPDQFGGVRMLMPLRDDSATNLTVIAGTTANCLLQIVFLTTTEIADAEKHESSVLTTGHFDDVGCLCTLVENGQSLALTAGMDGNINCFDLDSHKSMWRIFLKDAMVSAIDCYAAFLAVGTSDGKLKLFQLTTPELTFILQANVGKGRVSSIRFSPDGTLVAIASQDSEIYVYKFVEGDVNLTLSGKLDKHDNPVIALDWSKNPARDNHYVLHSNSFEFENFLWDAESGDYLEEAHFYRNVKWNTQSCVLGFAAVTSVTSEQSLDGYVVCTDVTPTLDMVAAVVSGEKNVVGLYSFPNANVQVVKHLQSTASSKISAVRFCYVNNQLYLLCTHAEDGCMTQWSMR